MCRIKAGSFVAGTDDPSYRGDHLPAQRVEVGGFLLDQYEVTNAQFAKYLNDIGSHQTCPGETDDACIILANVNPRTTILLEDGRYRPKEGLEDHPVHTVSWLAAKQYCEWAGKRLPTEFEWEYAARHDPRTGHDRVYPWGDEMEPGHANCDEEVCADGFEATAPVGSFTGRNGQEDGRSAFGVANMGGNAWEWTTCSGACSRGGAVIRGASFMAPNRETPAFERHRPQHDAAIFFSAGLRCVSS